jgi:hypothetical protein
MTQWPPYRWKKMVLYFCLFRKPALSHAQYYNNILTCLAILLQYLTNMWKILCLLAIFSMVSGGSLSFSRHHFRTWICIYWASSSFRWNWLGIDWSAPC